MEYELLIGFNGMTNISGCFMHRNSGPEDIVYIVVLFKFFI